MKKITILIVMYLLYIPLSFSQITQKVEFDVPDREIYQDEEGYTHISLEGTLLREEVGKPELPLLRQSFVLPVDAKVTGITINNMNRKRVEGAYLIYPAQPPVVIGMTQDKKDFVAPLASVYNSNNPFPEEQVEIITDQIERGYHIVTVHISPVEYMPLSKELYICSFDFTINYDKGEAPALPQDKATPSSRRLETMKEDIKQKVENKEDVDRFGNIYNSSSSVSRSSALTRSSEINIPDYIIITNNALHDSFKSLAEWKTKKGVNTRIKTVESIEEEYPGCDLQEKIRNYLKSVHQLWGDGMYVLLGGDTDIVPARMVQGYGCDLYYATVEGTWNEDRDDIFGESNEINYNYAFILGRAPVKTTAEAKVFVNKVLYYEKASIPLKDYFNNILLASAFLDNDNGIRRNLLNKHYYNAAQYVRSQSSTAKTWLMFDNYNCQGGSNYSYTGGYYPEYIGSCSSYKGNEEFNRNNFLNALSNGGGSGRYHIIAHIDHSSEVSMGTSGKDKGERVTREDFDILGNSSYHQIMFSNGCKPATFNVDCIGERYINNPRGGGVAFIGNSDDGYYSEVAQGERFIKYLFNPLNRNKSLGYAFQATPIGSERRRLTLLGDPEMQVWTAAPQTLQVTRSMTIDPVTGEHNMSVRIANLPSGQEALVCFHKEGDVYERFTISDTQTHIYTITPSTPGNLTTRITSRNFKPYQLTSIISGASKMKIETIDIGGEPYHPESFHLEAGKTYNMKIQIQNKGNADIANSASAIRANLICHSEYINILRTNINCPPIPIGGAKFTYDEFSFKVDPSIPDQVLETSNFLDFELKMPVTSGKIYSIPFRMKLEPSKIEISGIEVDAFYVNDPRTWKLIFSVNLINTGTMEETGVRARLSSRNPQISVPSHEYTYPDILPKTIEKTNSTTDFYAAVPISDVNDPIPLTLTVENAQGKTWTFDFDPNNRPSLVDKNSIRFTGYTNEIDLYWQTSSSVSGYNIYRSVEGFYEFEKVNLFPVTAGYYKDKGLEEAMRYEYKISSLNDDRIESVWEDPDDSFLAWTSLQVMDLFPVKMNVSGTGAIRNRGAIIVCDVDNDSRQEIFTTLDKGDNSNFGLIVALKNNGTDLFDIDRNPTTRSGFAKFNESIQGAVAVGDLYGNGEYQVVSVTRNFSSSTNYLTCHAIKDTNGDSNPDVLWQVPVNLRYRHGPILANVDNSSDKSLEIIICNSEAGTTGNMIRIYNNRGALLYAFGMNGNSYSSLAVADLDGDGDMEIIAGFEGGVYVWHHNGTPFSVNPFFTQSGYTFDSSPVICDLNGDGYKDIVLAGRSGGQRQIFAIDRNRNKLSGWGTNQKIPLTSGISYPCNVSVGDLNNNGSLEVVAIGTNCVKIWNNSGSLIKEITIPGLGVASAISPILADVDGDNECEVVFAFNNFVYGYKLNGSQVNGFPLFMHTGVTTNVCSVCVTDVTGNGKNNIIAGYEDKIYMWETNGSPKRIEWGSKRNGSHNRGEYIGVATGSMAFPVKMDITGTGNPRTRGAITVCDVDNDSRQEIFTTIDKGDDSNYGLIAAINANGTELFDIDRNPATRSGFAKFNESIQGAVAVGDLYGNGEYQVVSVTRNFASSTNYLTCHAIKDANGDSNPDVLWQVPVNLRYRYGPILANLDNSSDKSMEIIICNSEAGTTGNMIRVYNNRGTLLYAFAMNGNSYSTPTVADLDGDGDLEIIAGFKDGVYVWHHNGTPFSVNPFFTQSGYTFDSSPVVCDLNGDGYKDIILAGRSGAQRQIFAIDRNRNKLSGWGTNQKIPLPDGTSYPCNVSVGDLNSNGSLEVVAIGTNCVKIWNKSGTLMREIPISGLGSPSKIAPILADVDGDNECEVLFAYSKFVYGYKLNGNKLNGFPLVMHTGVTSNLCSVCVTDATGSGKNNLIAAYENKIYMWDTKGNPNRIEWGSQRNGNHNRGEYISPALRTGTQSTLELDMKNMEIVDSQLIDVVCINKQIQISSQPENQILNVSVYDIQGNLIEKKENINLPEYSLSVDRAAYATMYVVKVTTEKGTAIRKVVIQ